MEIHSIAPVYDASSEVLILGSFPSVKSREAGFYYAHPQNRFWRVLAAVFGEAIPESIDEKCALMRAHGVALWDVIGSCTVIGSSDASIRNTTPNDLTEILATAPIRRIYTNGQTAHRLYCRHLQAQTGIEAVALPSTSPANAAWSLDKLTETWGEIAARD